MGLLLDSDTMAQETHMGFDAQITDMAYAVSLDEIGDMRFSESQTDGS